MQQDVAGVSTGRQHCGGFKKQLPATLCFAVRQLGFITIQACCPQTWPVSSAQRKLFGLCSNDQLPKAMAAVDSTPETSHRLLASAANSSLHLHSTRQSKSTHCRSHIAARAAAHDPSWQPDLKGTTNRRLTFKCKPASHHAHASYTTLVTSGASELLLACSRNKA